MRTIHLQGLGEVDAVPVEVLTPGTLLAWNSSYGEYEVVGVEQVSAKFVALTERSVKTGEVFTRRMKIGRLVAVAN